MHEMSISSVIVVYSAVLRDVRIGTTDVAVYDPEVG
jgi:hypothetical protein